MVRVARFEKVSLRRFVADWVATFPQQTVEQAVAAYERIRLPERATSGSAGYDRSVLNSARAKASKFRRDFGC